MRKGASTAAKLLSVLWLGASLAFAAPAPVDYHAIMRATVDSWVASQSPDGFLPYEFDFLADAPTEPDRMSRQQFIRQVASAYALAKYYERFKDERLREPLRRALSAYASHSLPIGKRRLQRWLERARILSLPVGRWKLQAALDRLGLIYQPTGEARVLAPNGSYATTSPGAGAFALLTELAYARTSGDDSFARWRAGWLAGLLALHVPGRGFRQTATSIDDDDYYSNGEAWLALAAYHDRYRDDEITARTLREVDDAMIGRYSKEPNAYFYHWGAMAAAQRFATTRDPKFLAFVRDQTTLFLDRFQGSVKPQYNNCPAMEGMAAALGALREGGERETALARRVAAWLVGERDKLPRLQIQPGQQGMTFAGGAYLRAPRMAEFAGGFLAGLHEPTVRVDAAAHCLSAMLMLDAEALLAAR